MLLTSWLRALPFVVSRNARRRAAFKNRIRSRQGVTGTFATTVRPAETLEDRALLATITVTSLADNATVDGQVTLREAIQAANTDSAVDGSTAGAGGDTITFASGLLTSGDQSITLTQFDTGLDLGEFGPSAFTISSEITIQGPTGGNGLTIQRDINDPDEFRLFHTLASGELTLNHLTLSNGKAQGGDGGSSFLGGGGGGGAGLGGAILNQGQLTINASTLSGNTARGGAGGAITEYTGGSYGGGGGGSSQGAGITPPIGNAGGAGAIGGGAGGNYSTPAGMVGGNGAFGGGGGGLYDGGSGGAGGFGAGGGGGGSFYDFGGQYFGSGGTGGFAGGVGATAEYFGGEGGGGAGLGGAVFNHGGSVIITNSTLASNTAKGATGSFAAQGRGLGGAVFTRNGSVRILNSTIVGNFASDGGAVYAVADGPNDININGVGDFAATVFVANSILANSQIPGNAFEVAGAQLTGNLAGTFASNVIESLNGSGFGQFDSNGNSTADPQLASLADNGGPTFTFALQSGSPAIDSGNDGLVPSDLFDLDGDSDLTEPLPFDQRGSGFDRTSDPTVDIGAFEFQLVTTIADFEVTTLDDEDDGQTTQDADLSLREAVRLANANTNASQITFAAGLFSSGDQTITLAQFDTGLDANEAGPYALRINTNVSIIGPSGDNGLTIQRSTSDSNKFRLFYVYGGTGKESQADLTLENLTVSGGLAQGFDSGRAGASAGMGGAIFNRAGTVTVSHSTLTDNTSKGGNGDVLGVTHFGGAGLGQSGSQMAGGGPNANSGFGGGGNPSSAGGFGGGGGSSGNGGFGGGGGGVTGGGGFGGADSLGSRGGSGAGMGGAIFNESGTLNLINSTLAGNTATPGNGAKGLGGAVFTRNGRVEITSSTLAANTANDGGGAIYVVADAASGSGFTGGTATVVMVNSIFADTPNGASNYEEINLGGAGIDSTGTTNNVIESDPPVGSAPEVISSADPQLGPLADNGGPTKTMALLAGSPAIDAGSNAAASALTTDQRGTDFNRIENSTVDIGAFELAAPVLSAPTITTPTSANVNSTTAKLGGNVTSDGGDTITARGIVYALTSANASPQLGGTGVVNVTGTGTTGVFTVDVTGLTAGSDYSFVAYATNSTGTTYTSPVSTFTTPAPFSPGVDFNGGRGLNFAGAAYTLGYSFTTQANPVTIDALGLHTISTANQVVRIYQDGTSTNIASVTVSSTDPVSAATPNGRTFRYHAITPVTLLPNTTYSIVVDSTAGFIYCPGTATTDSNIVFGTGRASTQSSTLFPGSDGFGEGPYFAPAFRIQPTSPFVTSPTSTSVTSMSATLGGDVTGNGSSTITERGVVYALTSANANPQLGGTGVTHVTSAGTTGAFTVDVTGLAVGSAYSFVAYATNGIGTAYSSVATFTTAAGDFEVGTLDDEDDGQTTQDADLSLREAIRLANANADVSKITFASDLFTSGDQAIALSLFDTGLDSDEAGPSAFRISTDVTIVGPTSDNGLTIQRNASAGNFRLFYVYGGAGSEANAKLTLDSLTLRDGYALGGTTPGGGAGAGAGMGGAIFNRVGTVTVVNSTLNDNQARGGRANYTVMSGGGGLGSDGTGDSGGGPNGGASGVAGGFGGGGGPGGDGGFGGGGGSSRTVAGTGGFGGGGGSRGVGDDESFPALNNGGFGGSSGFGVPDQFIDDFENSIGGNGAGMGGAIFNESGTLTVINSTLTKNAAFGGRGGIAAAISFGGAVFTRNGLVTITQSTVAGNRLSDTVVSPGAGGGLFAVSDGASGSGFTGGTASVTLNNVILADTMLGPAGQGADFNIATINGAAAPTMSGTGNLIKENGGFTGGFITGVPLLGALADNGGPTFTMALLAGSPAIDAGDNAAAAGLTTDQRGDDFLRIVTGKIDIGAFEYTPPRNLRATLESGNLVVVDIASGGVSNQLSVTTDGNNLIISDATEFFETTSIPGASLSADTRTLTIPLTSITGGGISIDARGGTDIITFNATDVGTKGISVAAESVVVSGAVAAGSVSVTADAVAINSTINVGTGTVTIEQQFDGTKIDLGGADTSGTLGLTDTELDQITAGKLVIGQDEGAAITVSQDIDLTDTPAISILHLITEGGVTATDGALKVAGLAVAAEDAVTLNDSDTAITTLAISTSGAITVSQSGTITVGQVGDLQGVSNQSGSGNLALTSTSGGIASGSFRQISSTGDITLSASGDVNLQGSVGTTSGTDGALSITSTMGSVTTGMFAFLTANGVVTVSASGDVNLQGMVDNTTSTAGTLSVTSTSGGISTGSLASLSAKGTVTLSASGDVNLQGLVDNRTSTAGTLSITSTNGGFTTGNTASINAKGDVTLSVSENVNLIAGITTGGALSITSTDGGITGGNVANLAAKGDITLSAADDISLATQVSNTTGTGGKLSITSTGGGITTSSVGVLNAKGDITLLAADKINLGGSLSTTSGTVGTVSITSQNGGISTGDFTSLDALGDITLSASDKIGLGGSVSNTTGPGGTLSITSKNGGITTGSFIDLTIKGDVTLSAFDNVELGGSIITTAGTTGTLSITSTDGGITTGSFASLSAKGQITLLAAEAVSLAGNLDNTSSPSPQITVSAQNVNLLGSINAGAGTVKIQNTAAGTEIDLGSETVNKLSITNTELNKITAKTIAIGSESAGPILVSAALNHTAVNTLSLIGNTTFGPSSNYTFQIGGTGEGASDHITVTGKLTIDSAAKLDLTAINSFVFSGSDQIQLIGNDSDDAVTGQFAGFPVDNVLGSTLPGFLNYVGGSGNDIVLLSDATPPTLMITPGSGVTNSSPITFTFQFSETVTGFDASDVTVTNGTKGTFTAVDGDTYALEVTPTEEGTVTASVGADAAQDVGANGNALASASIQSDRSGPVFSTTATPSVPENTTAVLTVAATDANGPATFTITGGDDASLFDLTSAGVLTFKAAHDFEAPNDSGVNNVYDLIITATDSLGNTRTQNVAVSVTPVNESSPVITSQQSLIVGEKISSVFTVTATDADLGENVTFSILGTDADQARFTITSDGKLSFSPAPNFNSPTDIGSDNVYNLTIMASDGAGGSVTQNVDIMVAGISVTLVEGNLVVSDTTDKGLVNTLTVDADLSRQVLVITETTHTIAINVAGAARVNNKTVEVPFSAIGGSKIIVNGGLANDTVTVTKTGSGAAFAKTIEVHGDGGNDVLLGSSLNELLNGGIGDDTLTAGQGNDTIIGGAGNDRLIESGDVNFVLTNSSMTGLGTDVVSGLEFAVLTGGAGANTIDASGASFSMVLNGGDGNDVLLGSSVNDTLNGGSGNDLLYGLGGRDSLDGSDGSDSLDGGASNDTLNGGAGVDRARRKNDFNFEVTNTELRELNGSTMIAFDSLVSMETVTLIGGLANNRFDLTAFNNTGLAVVEGGGGNDTVLGSEGLDSITTGSGIDVIEGRGGNDSIISGDGDDVVQGGLGNDYLDGQAGNDSLVGGIGNDILLGNSGKDTLTGNDGNDTINGGAGVDLLMEVADVNFVLTNSSLTGVGNDFLGALESALLTGGNSANNIDASAATFSVSLNGGPGADTLTGSSAADAINGGTGNDTLYGLGGQDVLFGSFGNDFLDGGASHDTLIGADGIDTAHRRNNTNFRVDNAGMNELVGDVVIATDLFSSIETISIVGGVGGNRIDLSAFTNSGVTTIQGGGGDDTIIGSNGQDLITTTSGADVIDGRGGSDTIVSGDGADSVRGGDGNDSLNGQSGDDMVLGEAGDDSLAGGAGSDQIDGGPGANRVVETADGNVVIIGTQFTSDVLGNNDVIQNVSAITLRGGVGNNLFDARRSSVSVQLLGGDGNDTLLGSNGRDLLQGGAGNDVILGGNNVDTIDGGLGTDILYETGNADFIVNKLQVTVGGSAVVDAITAIEGIVLVGGVGNNSLDARLSSVPVTLLGGGGNDVLNGSRFADVLIGGNRASSASGRDTLNGQASNDLLDNDPADTRTPDAGDQLIADLFAQLPTWIDAL